MEFDLPEHVAAKSADLGTPLAHFETSRVQTLLCLILSVPIALAGVGGCILGIGVIINPNVRGVFSGKIFLLSIFSIVTGLGLLGRWRKLRGTGVFVFAEGLVRYRRDECEVMRWDEVHLVRRGIPPGKQELTMATPSRIALTDADGREWVFTEALSDVKAFRDLAERHTLDFMLPAGMEALDCGRTLTFGPVDVTREGLSCPRQPALTWDQVAETGVEGGKVFIRSSLARKKYLSVPVYEVPNVHLLLALIARFGGREGVE